MWNGTMFVDLDWPLNASSLLSASAELLVELEIALLTSPAANCPVSFPVRLLIRKLLFWLRLKLPSSVHRSQTYSFSIICRQLACRHCWATCVQCAKSPMNLAEFATQSGRSWLQPSINFVDGNNFNYRIITQKTKSQWRHHRVKLVLILLK